MVFGDSTADISLFKLFPHSVLIINPILAVEQIQMLKEVARYVSTTRGSLRVYRTSTLPLVTSTFA